MENSDGSSVLATQHKAIKIVNYSDKRARCVFGTPRFINGIFGPDGEVAGDRAYITFSYEDWSNKSPSTPEPIHGSKQFQCIEFIDIIFPKYLLAERLELTGREINGVVRIYGCSVHENVLNGSWSMLWTSVTKNETPIHDTDDHLDVNNWRSAWATDYKFTNQICCNLIRVEFDKTAGIHEIWSAEVIGNASKKATQFLIDPEDALKFITDYCAYSYGSVLTRLWNRQPSGKALGGLEVSQFLQVTAGWLPVVDSSNDTAEPNTANAIRRQLTDSATKKYQGSIHDGVSIIERLPSEVLIHILNWLDVDDLCRVARCSRILNAGAWTVLTRPRNRQLYLRPYWRGVNDTFLSVLARADGLLIEHLDLSWCGSYGSISVDGGLRPLLMACGSHLSILRLTCCDAVNDDVLMTIACHCPNVIELDVSGCGGISAYGLRHLIPIAPTFHRIELVRSRIGPDAALRFFGQTVALCHLDISSCDLIAPRLVVQALATSAKSLKTIQMRFMQYVTPHDLRHLAESCPLLEELDITKSYRSGGVGVLHNILPHWSRMRKLFIGGARSISAGDIASMWEFCPLLEQADISGAQVGSGGTSLYNAVEKLLSHCSNLIFLDVSYADLQLIEVDRLRTIYPQITIRQDRLPSLR